jgi:hypothetical protein
MKKTFLAAATALSMIAVPALADNHESDPMTAEQQVIYDALSAADQAEFDSYTVDQRTAYFGWNAPLRDYYWTLNADQQDAWWYLNDDQRTQIFQIPAEQRTAAWNSVVAQVAEMENGTTPANQQAAASDNMSDDADVRFVSNEVVQNAPAPHQGEYPVCESDADDNCINAWAAGQRGPGVDRPLDYWPGEASSS